MNKYLVTISQVWGKSSWSYSTLSHPLFIIRTVSTLDFMLSSYDSPYGSRGYNAVPFLLCDKESSLVVIQACLESHHLSDGIFKLRSWLWAHFSLPDIICPEIDVRLFRQSYHCCHHLVGQSTRPTIKLDSGWEITKQRIHSHDGGTNAIKPSAMSVLPRKYSYKVT